MGTSGWEPISPPAAASLWWSDTTPSLMTVTGTSMSSLDWNSNLGQATPGEINYSQWFNRRLGCFKVRSDRAHRSHPVGQVLKI